MGTRTNRLCGAAGAVAVAFVPLALGTLPANAVDTITQQVKVTQSNWYWESPVAVAAEHLPIPENPIPAGILIPEGDLAVSLTNVVTNEPDRVTYLQFGVGGANETARVTSFTFTLKVDSANLTNVALPSPPSLVACYPSRAWDGGDGATSYSKKPVEDCDSAAKGVYDAKAESYTFQVSNFAQDWVEGSNLGVAVRSSAEQQTPFILAFEGPKSVKATIAYVQGVSAAEQNDTPIAAPPVVLPDVTPAETVDAPYVEPVVSIPVTPTAPVVAAPVANGTGVFTAAGGVRAIGETSYDATFWWSLLAGLVAVGVVGWFMGRRPTLVAQTADSSRLAQVLAARAHARQAGH